MAALLSLGSLALAQSEDMGIPELRALNPALTGSGISVTQAEAQLTGNNDWEVNPSAVYQAAGKFTYISASGTSTSFTNSLGVESGHADSVGQNFYGGDGLGVAPGVTAIYNYEADYFVNDVIPDGAQIPTEIVNQSFVANTSDTADQEELEQEYDNYAAYYGTLFISGAGNGGPVDAPASAYNGIAVGSYDNGVSTSYGTYDGRSKPDIVAVSSNPSGATSYTTPVVSGAATLLLQAAQDGDAGSSPQVVSDGSDARVIKALLLNGATKTAGWKSTVSQADQTTTPLDPITGAGLLNVYNSYLNLTAGEQSASSLSSGTVAPAASGATQPDEGWELGTLTNSFSVAQQTYLNESAHYRFDLSGATAPEFTLTATIDWNREFNESSINNLFLLLYDTDTDQLVDSSVSTIDNVQQIYVPSLAPGDYDLVVEKSGSNVVSAADTYALAFNFAPVPEPAVVWLLPAGAGLAFLGRKRRARLA
jgi:hypothetical protein